jgi:STE24 endopeptidase
MWWLIGLWLLVVLAGVALESLNLRHLRAYGHEVPPELAGTVDASALHAISAYTLERGRLHRVKMLVLNAVAGLFLFGGGLAWYDRGVTAWVRHLAGASAADLGTAPGPHPLRFILQGVLFLAGIVVLETLLEVPFSLYGNFRVEARHGFNRLTRRLWLGDMAKGLLVSLVIATLAASGALWLIGRSPEHWWLWVWGFFLAAGIFLMYVSPYVIEPLFYKFTPLAVEGLEERIRALAARAGLRVSRILQVDASRRSRHSNAYFTGIGPVKRIVLFDTLLTGAAPGEILAVLAHEMGHWKLRHVLRRLLTLEATALVALFAAFRVLRWEGLPNLAGLPIASFPARVMIAGFAASLLALPLAPLGSALSRRDEWAADRYATRLTGTPGDLASALAKLARDNLANLHPHPLYAWIFYSHPPVGERIRELRRAATVPGGGA